MSLELKIDELNVNITKLIGALNALGQSVPEETVQLAPIGSAPKATTVAKSAEPEPAAPAPADYETVKKAVLRLAAVNRTKAVEILGKYGAKRVQDLNESDYANVLFIVQAELGE